MKNYVLKIKLENTDISRTVAIPADYGFFDLHEVIQIVFGWEDYYFHEFNIAGVTIADDDNDDNYLLPERYKYEYECNLEFFLMNAKKFSYTYDVEQPWVHDIEVEGILEEGFDLPVLLESEGVMVVETPADEGETQVTYGRAPDKNALNIELRRTFTS